MRLTELHTLSFLASFAILASVLADSELHNNRHKKDFSLFSVVQFDNVECTSDGTPAGGATQGTCFTSSECTNKAGTAAGRCAAGFGVCCVFLNIGATTSTVTENRTRLRNAEFGGNPSIVQSAQNLNIVYTVNKMSTDICQIRLDFTTFVIRGPINSAENIAANIAGTHCGTDALTILTTDRPNAVDSNVGTLCGALTGEHLYIELSPTAGDNLMVTLNLAALPAAPNTVTARTGFARTWDIKVSQIECFASYRAPQGCDRYFMTDSGKITSFNFFRRAGTTPGATGFESNTGLELAMQRVKSCIRRSKHMCCVEYQLCTGFNGAVLAGDATQAAASPAAGTTSTISEAFSIDTDTGAKYIIDATEDNVGMVDAMCTGDYVEIPSSFSGPCGGSAQNTLNSRYCGPRFGANFVAAVAATTTSTPVCDCSEPFVVRHNSDDVSDLGGFLGQGVANLNAAVIPRGFCLDFRQKTC